jgi:hypothetical protein
MPVADTLLSFEDVEFTLQPYSVRGIRYTLSPIAQAASIRRDVNGSLVNLGQSQFQKYRMELTCTDVEAPNFDALWPGQTVTVYSGQELCYLTSTGGPNRDVVTDSSRVEGSFTFYRPVFTMMVTAKEQTFDEWGASVGWSLGLEEI